MVKKRFIALIGLLLFSLSLIAQNYTGGIKGIIISRSDRSPIVDATLTVYKDNHQQLKVTTNQSGKFYMDNLSNGLYIIKIEAPGYLLTQVNVTIRKGVFRNIFNIGLTPIHSEVINDDMEEKDMDDSGYEDSPTILYGQNDIFNNIAGYNFSSVRFKARGYSNESQDVYLAGVLMNDAVTGYAPYSLWSGLNEVTRAKTSVNGAEISNYGIGGYNGLTNIDGMASKVRKGLRGSVLTNSALYRLRLMLTYASGELDNGWNYAVSASARLGGNDWVKGVYYRSFAYYISAEKRFNDTHKIGFTFMATPGQRGAQNGSTQEVYDLLKDNMYNSNWGFQNGKVRNSRVRITNEPIAILKYDYTPSSNFNASATFLYRFGKNGYTALDWYNAPDPRPDYYRNLPSYFYMPNSDYGRNNPIKAAWARDAWQNDIASICHVDWDRMYNVNRNSITQYGKRSKYALEERRVDQQDLNLALRADWRLNNNLVVAGGFNGKINRSENYKIMNDLLGGDYYVNIDQFAERDFAAYPTMIQNDLDYFLSHNGQSQHIKKGDKYGYDYYAQIRRAQAWLSSKFNYSGLEVNIGGTLGYTCFWRDGLLRKGLFPGLGKDGKPMSYNGSVITTYDKDNQPITSLGKSKVSKFLTYSGKLNLSYTFLGGHRVYADVAYFSQAPTFKRSFISPRTRNSIVKNLKNVKTFTSDINYQFRNDGYNVRLTAYFTQINDQSDVMSFYDDSQNSFTNFAMTGINERHLGIELGFSVPTPVSNLSLQGVLSLGRFTYTSNPYVTQTLDNSAKTLIDNRIIPYWMSNPTENGKTQQHFVPGTPQIASSLGLNWSKNYWFIDADVDYFAHNYLSMNPLYRTDMATMGPDGQVTNKEIEYMASQEEFKPVFLLNLSVGKSWYIHYKYQLGFSLNARNLLNNTNLRTGGYEQTRLVDNTVSKERFYKFDPKYFYMNGFNYMLNIYFRF